MRWSQKLVMLSLSVLLLSCSAIPPRLRTVNILVDEDISLAAGDRVNVFMIDEAQTNDSRSGACRSVSDLRGPARGPL